MSPVRRLVSPSLCFRHLNGENGYFSDTRKKPDTVGLGTILSPFLSYALALVMANYILERKRGKSLIQFVLCLLILFVFMCCIFYGIYYFLSNKGENLKQLISILKNKRR